MATAFRLWEVAPRRAVFDNPGHDFLRRITYWQDESDSLHARIEGEHDGRTVGMTWD